MALYQRWVGCWEKRIKNARALLPTFNQECSLTWVSSAVQMPDCMLTNTHTHTHTDIHTHRARGRERERERQRGGEGGMEGEEKGGGMGEREGGRERASEGGRERESLQTWHHVFKPFSHKFFQYCSVHNQSLHKAWIKHLKLSGTFLHKLQNDGFWLASVNRQVINWGEINIIS